MKLRLSGVLLTLACLSSPAPAVAATGVCDTSPWYSGSCNGYGQSGCEARDGCFWVPPNGSGNPGCGGTPTACSTFGSRGACIQQNGCTWTVIAECGDEQVDSPEECDDGNKSSNDGCSADCLLECGDGVVGPNEECDDGNRASFDGCSKECKIELCGNGTLDPGEACDDGNHRSGDGCSNRCVIEAANIENMSVAPRRLEWAINARVAMTPTAKTVQITYPRSDHALTIRPSDIRITGPQASYFTFLPSASLPFALDRGHPLRIDVAYTGPINSNRVAEATLVVDGHFFSATRQVQASLRTHVYNPEVEVYPAVIPTYQDAPCGGFGPDDLWTSEARSGLVVNSYPATQRIHAISPVQASQGAIGISFRDPTVSLPVDLAPGESLEYRLVWSGQGPAPEGEGQIEVTVEDLESTDVYSVAQTAMYRQIEDCTKPRLAITDLVNFGISEVGVASTAQMPYFNTGTADLEIQAITDCGAPAPNATFDHLASLPLTLAPTGYTGTQTLPFRVVPDEPGIHSQCVKVVTNDEIGEYEVELFTVTANREVLMVPDLVELSPSNPTKTVLVMNVGALPIVIRQSGLVIDPAFTFSLVGQSFPVTLPAGDVLEVLVSAVDWEADASGTLDLDTDAQDGLPVVGDSVGLSFDAP